MEGLPAQSQSTFDAGAAGAYTMPEPVMFMSENGHYDSLPLNVGYVVPRTTHLGR